MIHELILPPVTTMECHASSLLPLSNSEFLVVWFQGSKEGGNDVAIWGARRTGAGWLPPQQLAKINNLPHWNPVLFRNPSGEIQLFFKVGRTIAQWQTWTSTSHDEGRHWSRPRELVPMDRSGGRGPVKNKPICLVDGTILAPGSIEKKYWRPFIDRLAPQSHEWERSPNIRMPRQTVFRNGIPGFLGAIQPTLWSTSCSSVHMLLRSNAGCLFRSDSEDGGRSWKTAYPTSLPNNNSGIDLCAWSDGTLALVCNTSNINWGPRNAIAIRFSEDCGNSWSEEFLLEESPDNAEYSYPAVCTVDDKQLAITYTWKRQSIRFWLGERAEFRRLKPGASAIGNRAYS